MPAKVHVTASQADAARMIVERDSANGKHTPEAIRKIATAQAQPEPANRPGPRASVSGAIRGRFRALLAKTPWGRPAAGGGSAKLSPRSVAGASARRTGSRKR
jgi:uncharacterized protein with LGFP repeats